MYAPNTTALILKKCGNCKFNNPQAPPTGQKVGRKKGGGMTEKKYAPQERYIKDNIRRFVLNTNRNTEADLIEHLEGQKNVQKYIRDLIRADMKKQGK